MMDGIEVFKGNKYSFGRNKTCSLLETTPKRGGGIVPTIDVVVSAFLWPNPKRIFQICCGTNRFVIVSFYYTNIETSDIPRRTLGHPDGMRAEAFLYKCE